MSTENEQVSHEMNSAYLAQLHNTRMFQLFLKRVELVPLIGNGICKQLGCSQFIFDYSLVWNWFFLFGIKLLAVGPINVDFQLFLKSVKLVPPL